MVSVIFPAYLFVLVGRRSLQMPALAMSGLGMVPVLIRSPIAYIAPDITAGELCLSRVDLIAKKAPEANERLVVRNYPQQRLRVLLSARSRRRGRWYVWASVAVTVAGAGWRNMSCLLCLVYTDA